MNLNLVYYNKLYNIFHFKNLTLIAFIAVPHHALST